MMPLRSTLAAVLLFALTVPAFAQHDWTFAGGVHIGLLHPIAWAPVVATQSPQSPRYADATITPTTTWGASVLAGYGITDWLSLRTGAIMDLQNYHVVFNESIADADGSSTFQSNNMATLAMVTFPVEALASLSISGHGASVILGLGAGYTVQTQGYEGTVVSLHDNGTDLLQTTDRTVITMDPTSFITVHGRVGLRAPLTEAISLECGIHGTLYPGTDHLMEITSTTEGSQAEPVVSSTARRDWYHQLRATMGVVVTL